MVGFKTRRDRLLLFTPLLLLLAVGFLFYLPSLRGYFLADDFAYIQFYSSKKLSGFPSQFIENTAPGIWGFNPQELRPVRGLTYWLDFRIWGANPFGFHLTNLILYLLAAAGLYFLVFEASGGLAEPERFDKLGGVQSMSMVGGTVGAAALATLFFMLHPSHAEALAWISGRVDLIAAVAYLWGFYGLLRYLNGSGPAALLLGNAIFAAGLFAKENLVTLPAVLLFYMLLIPASHPPVSGTHWRRRAIALLPPSFIAIFWILLRRMMLGSALRFENSGQALAFIRRFPFYAGQIFWLAPKPAMIVLCLFVLGCGVYSILKRDLWSRAILFWGVVWPALQLLPLVPVGYESSRHVFLAAAGPIVVFVLAVSVLWRKQWLLKCLILVAVFALLIFFTGQAWQGIAHWKQAGDYSRSLAGVLQNGHYSSDDIVVAASHPPITDIWFWNWALPYAAQPPFMDFQGRILESSDWYCCLDWIEKRRPLWEDLRNGKRASVHRIDFNPGNGQYEDHVVENPFRAGLEAGTAEPITQEKADQWIAKLQASRILK